MHCKDSVDLFSDLFILDNLGELAFFFKINYGVQNQKLLLYRIKCEGAARHF